MSSKKTQVAIDYSRKSFLKYIICFLLIFFFIGCASNQTNVDLSGKNNVINDGISLYDNASYDETIKYYNTLLAKGTTNSMIHNNLSIAYYQKKEHDKAIQNYKKALLKDSKASILYNNLGAVYYEKGLYAKAISNYTKAIRYDPNYFSAYINRGVIYLLEKKYDKAIEDFSKIDPFSFKRKSSFDYYKDLYDKAAQKYSIRKTNGKYVLAYYNLRWAKNRLEQVGKIKKDYADSIKDGKIFVVSNQTQKKNSN